AWPGAGLAAPAGGMLHVLEHRRVGVVVGKAPVGVAEERRDARAEPLVESRGDEPSGAVAGVHDDPDGPAEAAQAAGDVVLVRRDHRTVLATAPSRSQRSALDPRSQRLDALAVQRLRTEAGLEA